MRIGHLDWFRDWPEEQVRGIAAPALVPVGDADVVRPEHAVEMGRLPPMHGSPSFPSPIAAA